MRVVESNAAPARITMAARLTLFGSSSRPAALEVTLRPRARRGTRAITTGVVALLLALLAAIIPPHFPWLLLVLGIGAWRARTEWRGELELHAFEGECPRCGAKLTFDERYITLPETVPCYSCQAQPQLIAAS